MSRSLISLAKLLTVAYETVTILPAFNFFTSNTLFYNLLGVFFFILKWLIAVNLFWRYDLSKMSVWSNFGGCLG